MVTWSLDGAEVCYQGTAVRMERITQLYHRTLEQAPTIYHACHPPPCPTASLDTVLAGDLLWIRVAASVDF